MSTETTGEPGAIDERARDIRTYWTYRRRFSRACLGIALAVATLLVFHKPENWGLRGEGRVVHSAALFVLAVSGLVAWIYVAKMAEQKGYCRGKHGVTTFSPQP